VQEDARPLVLEPGDIIPATTKIDGSVYFEITRELGRGGGGVVYEALNDDGCFAVIKAPHRVGDPSESLRRERDHLFDLRHRNVLEAIAWHEDSRGHGLLILERVYDNPLVWAGTPVSRGGGAELVARVAPVPPVSVCLELFFDLLTALDYLHTKGLLHLDIKPRNMMLALPVADSELIPEDYLQLLCAGRWCGALIDFGGALDSGTVRQLNGARHPVAVEMTPYFAPPEILPGVDGPGGSQRPLYGIGADLYAAGLTLATWLTGRPPYSHLESPPGSRDLVGIANAKRAERRGGLRPYDIESLLVADMSDTEINGRASEFMSRIVGLIERLAHPDPRRRGTAGQALEMLEALLRVKPVSVHDARAMRRAPEDHPRSIRPYVFEGLSLAKRNRYERFLPSKRKVSAKLHKIRRGGADFWETLGMG